MASHDSERRPPGARPSPGVLLALAALGASAELAGQALSPGAPLEAPFEDVTAEVGLDFVHQNGMTGQLWFVEMMGAGGGLVDYDGDGDLDLYLVQGGRIVPDVPLLLPDPHPEPWTDRLYRNDLVPAADGTARVRLIDVTERAGLSPGSYGMGLAAGDFDADGRIDLYVTAFGSNRLLRNAGDGTFEDSTAAAGADDPRWSVPAVFFDADGDGRLDLYVGNYVDWSLGKHQPCTSVAGKRDYCGPRIFEPETDRLLRNLGDGTFEDSTAAAGIDAPGATLGAVADDLDGDGDLDLYVANDLMANFLWANRGDGSFTDEALLAGAAVDEAGRAEASMGVVFGDVDGDGDGDLFMTHFHRQTNTLYLQEGAGLFRDATRGSGLDLPSWERTGFGIALVDFDLDGSPDLFVANGAVRRIEEQVARGETLPLAEPAQLFRNLSERGGPPRFVEVTGIAALEEPMVGRGVAAGDVDGDGDEDLLVTANGGPARLLASRGADAGGRWIGIAPVAGHPAAVVPEVRAEARPQGGGRPVGGRTGSDGSYASASDPRLVLGLGGAAGIARLTLEDPAGRRRAWEGLQADRWLVVPWEAEGRGPAREPPPEAPPGGAE